MADPSLSVEKKKKKKDKSGTDENEFVIKPEDAVMTLDTSKWPLLLKV